MTTPADQLADALRAALGSPQIDGDLPQDIIDQCEQALTAYEASKAATADDVRESALSYVSTFCAVHATNERDKTELQKRFDIIRHSIQAAQRQPDVVTDAFSVDLVNDVIRAHHKKNPNLYLPSYMRLALKTGLEVIADLHPNGLRIVKERA